MNKPVSNISRQTSAFKVLECFIWRLKCICIQILKRNNLIIQNLEAAHFFCYPRHKITTVVFLITLERLTIIMNYQARNTQYNFQVINVQTNGIL